MFIVAGLVTTVPPLCGVVTALLQYFILVFFDWIAVEALFLYQKLVRNVLGEISPYFVPTAAAVVWCKYRTEFTCICKGLKRDCDNTFWSFDDEYP